MDSIKMALEIGIAANVSSCFLPKEAAQLLLLIEAAEKLADYRQRVGPLGFQLEKLDDYLREINLILEGQDA